MEKTDLVFSDLDMERLNKDLNRLMPEASHMIQIGMNWPDWICISSSKDLLGDEFSVSNLYKEPPKPELYVRHARRCFHLARRKIMYGDRSDG